MGIENQHIKSRDGPPCQRRTIALRSVQRAHCAPTRYYACRCDTGKGCRMYISIACCTTFPKVERPSTAIVAVKLQARTSTVPLPPISPVTTSMGHLRLCWQLLCYASAAAFTVGAYFPNYAKYRPSPYTFTAADLAPIMSNITDLSYFVYYFCPPPGTSPMPYWSVAPYGNCDDSTAWTLLSVEPSDPAFLATIIGYKAQNPELKVLISVGGWNFPSAYFSALAASATARSAFAESARALLAATGADGISLDWEAPCSVPREADVEISCTEFRVVSDAGGRCPDDTENVPLLVQALRDAMPAGAIVTLATQASRQLELEMNVTALAAEADWLDIMTYDYTVSDIADPGPTAPNAPLYTPRSTPSIAQMSVNDTVANYIAAGVPRSKIRVGIPLYGHSWYVPAIGDGWSAFGAAAVQQGACCGPLKPTRGAQPGLGAQQCGTMMYSEILAAAPQHNATDAETASTVAYWSAPGADGGHTAAGTWLSYNDAQSVAATAAWARAQGLAGVFVFDASMDSSDWALVRAVVAGAAPS